MTTASPTLDSFRDLSTEELIVLGLLWKFFTEVEASPRWGSAREVILEGLTPEDGADIRSAHAARVESEGWTLPVECYAAVQWSYLVDREKDKMPKAAYKDAMRSWSALFPKAEVDPEIISRIVEASVITDEGFFDLSAPTAPRSIGTPAAEPDWDGENEKSRLRDLLSPLLMG